MHPHLRPEQLPRPSAFQAERPVEFPVRAGDSVYAGEAVLLNQTADGLRVIHMNQDNPGAGRLNSPSRPGNIPERFAAKRTTGMAQEHQRHWRRFS